MKRFCFTVDDNIRFLRELTEGQYESMLDHPYLAMYRRLHAAYGIKVQLNLFYQMKGFDLSHVTDRYRADWQRNADWLRLSFHSRRENVTPYAHSDYTEVAADCEAVHRQILRFAGKDALARTTTVHYCCTTGDGVRALWDHGVIGLLGLYGTTEAPRTSYDVSPAEGNRIRNGEVITHNGMAHGGINLIVNRHTKEESLLRLETLTDRPLVKLMIHEQYFYPDYPRYQADFEEKLAACFALLRDRGFSSVFFESCLDNEPDKTTL